MQKRTVRPSLAAVAVLVALACVGSYLIASRLAQRYSKTIRTAVALPCLPEQQVSTLGDMVLYYDGTSLRALDASGRQKWDYLLGAGASYQADSAGITAWVDHKLYLLSTEGKQRFIRELESPVLSARAGDTYVAVHVGEEQNSELVVFDKGGSKRVARYEFANQIVLDYGFYADGGMLWAMTLDTAGTVPMSTISTYQPGKTAGPVITDIDQVIYRVLFSGRQIKVVGTTYIKTYLQRDEQLDKRLLVYGWMMLKHYPAGESDTMLLVPVDQADGELNVQDIKLVEGTQRMVRLPLPCHYVDMIGQTVYGFTDQYAFIVKGGSPPDAYTLPSGLRCDRVLGMTEGRGALMVSGGVVYLVSMPN